MKRVLGVLLLLLCAPLGAEHTRSADTFQSPAFASRGFVDVAGASIRVSSASGSCGAFATTDRVLSVESGKAYALLSYHPYDTVADGEGGQILFNTGTATFSTFLVSCTSVAASGAFEVSSSAIITSPAGTPTVPTLTAGAAHYYRCTGGLRVAVGGTVNLQFNSPACAIGSGIGAGSYLRLVRLQ